MSITDSPNFDLHPITIDDIATGLINSYYSSWCCKRISLKDFPIVLVRQHHTVPQLHKNEIVTIEFPIGKRIIQYTLKAISIVLDGEHTFILFEKRASPTHAFALIQQNNQWKLMNDQFSIKISDIESITNMLKLEKVA
ncbi:hypothetical protein SNEBB_010533, partial [Seison nebaliae]